MVILAKAITVRVDDDVKEQAEIMIFGMYMGMNGNVTAQSSR
jgi:antitoxin component of RelBE/YafQ-DinJ toxin-antitoxin module